MTDPTQPARPTNVRWRIVGLLSLTAVLCHFNRVSMAVAGTEHIIGNRGISETQMSWVYTAYLVVYTILMTGGGWLIDRRGPRAALLMMGFGSAVFVSLTGVVGMVATTPMLLLWGLIAVRCLLGSVTVPMHPGAARMVSFWTPPGERSLANGAVTFAALIGIAFAPHGFGFLSDHLGWPAAFMVGGVAAALCAVIWALAARDGPHLHPAANFEERTLIESGRAPLKDGGTESGLAGLLRNRSLVLLTLSYAAAGYFQYLFVYWIQYYFKNILHLETGQSRTYTMIAMLAMAVGMIGGGWLCDRIELRAGQRRGRAIVCIASMTVSAAFLLMGIVGHGTTWIVTCFALAMGVLGVSEAPFWTTATQVGSARGGISAAIMNTGGNGGGLLAPVITPYFSKYFGWQSGLALACVVSVLGAICWLWIDPAEKTPPRAPEGP